jgi:hypothetical protein
VGTLQAPELIESARSSVCRSVVMHEYMGQERSTECACDLLNCRLVQLLPFDYLHCDVDKRRAKAVAEYDRLYTSSEASRTSFAIKDCWSEGKIGIRKCSRILRLTCPCTPPLAKRINWADPCRVFMNVTAYSGSIRGSSICGLAKCRTALQGIQGRPARPMLRCRDW